MTTSQARQTLPPTSPLSAAPSPPTPTSRSSINTPPKGSPDSNLHHNEANRQYSGSTSGLNHPSERCEPHRSLALSNRPANLHRSHEVTAASTLQSLSTTSLDQPKSKTAFASNGVHPDALSKATYPRPPSLKALPSIATTVGALSDTDRKTWSGVRVPGPGLPSPYSPSLTFSPRTITTPSDHSPSVQRTHDNRSPHAHQYNPYARRELARPELLRSTIHPYHTKLPFQSPRTLLPSPQSPLSPNSADNANGFRIVHGAVLLEIVQPAVDMMEQGLPVHSKHDTHITYETSLAVYEVRDAFRKVCSVQIPVLL